MSRKLIAFLRYSPAHIIRLFFITIVMPAVTAIAPRAARIYSVIRVRLSRHVWTRQRLRNLEANRDKIIDLSRNRYLLRLDELGVGSDALAKLRSAAKSSPIVKIAEIDQDGLIASEYGPIGDLPLIDAARFTPRTRYSLQIVAIGDHVGIKKDFKGNKHRFANELTALHQLALAGCNVPSILDFDIQKTVLVCA